MKPLTTLLLAFLPLVRATLINQSIKRHIDLTKHIVRVQLQIKFVDAENPVNEYKLTIPKGIAARVAHINVRSNGSIARSLVQTQESSHVEYIVNLAEPAGVNQVTSIKVTMFLTRVLEPFPAQITQYDDQFVLYNDFVYVSSPYATLEQMTKVKLPSIQVNDFTRENPVKRKGSTITYGPYKNMEPNVVKLTPLRLHFRTSAPFITVTKLIKEIEVSMWGRVSVEEVYDLQNSGAMLKGGFSRLDYSNGQRGVSFDQLHVQLPDDPINIYYRDQIGNVSTSALIYSGGSQALILSPRFPLMGGWKTQFYYGYSVPTESVLSHSAEKFRLTIPFGCPIDGAAVDTMTLKVILPEGARNIKVSIPFDIDQLNQTRRLTFLDTSLVGRPVLVINKANLVAKHYVPFVVTFDFPEIFMLLEPALLISAFFVIFVLISIIIRCNFSASASVKKSKKD